MQRLVTFIKIIKAFFTENKASFPDNFLEEERKKGNLFESKLNYNTIKLNVKILKSIYSSAWMVSSILTPKTFQAGYKKRIPFSPALL